MSHGEATRAAGRLPIASWYGAIGLIALFGAGAIVESVHLTSLQSPAVWTHLRSGMWILENTRIPRNGIYSQAANLRWQDFSWGYDVLVGIAYRIVGIRAVPLLAIGFRAMVAAVLFLLAGGHRGRSVSASVVALVGVYALSRTEPSSTAVSVVLFGFELLLLFEWGREPKSRAIFVLPLLVLVWANLDIGFIYGTVALAVFVISRYAKQVGAKGAATVAERQRLGTAVVLFVVCLIIGGITPYGYGSYSVFWQTETSTANLNIPGYGAMGFRRATDYVVLLLAMGAFLAMGLRRSRDAFLIALMCVSAALAFHSQRENWLLIVSSVAVIGDVIPVPSEAGEQNDARSSRGLLIIGGSMLLAIGLVFLLFVPRDSQRLMARVARNFPVKACDYIRNERLPEPLFNAYQWGGFVTWYLPEYPVAIDDRRGLYPEEFESDYFKVMKVDLPYQSLAAMKGARTILLEKSNVVAGGLRNVTGFRVVYEDDVAIVLLQGGKE